MEMSGDGLEGKQSKNALHEYEDNMKEKANPRKIKIVLSLFSVLDVEKSDEHIFS